MKPASPQQLRESMAKGYMDGYARAGIKVSFAEAERQAAADCELVDAARRSGDMTRPGPTKGPKPKRRDPIAEATHETGHRILAPGEHGQAIKSRALHGNPQAISERWGLAVGRLQRILREGVEKRSDIVTAVNGGGVLAKLAAEYAEVFGSYMFRHARAPISGKDHNPFRGMSDRDAARLFMRKVEDICDKSAKTLGPWMVPK